MRPFPLILMYHRVVERLESRDPTGNTISVKDFEGQLRWLLSRRFSCVPLARIAAATADVERGRALPDRPFAITFDDGYRDNHRVAWPVLRGLGLTATVFVVTDCIGGANEFDREAGSYPVQMLTADEISEMNEGGIEFGSHTRTHPDDLTALPAGALEKELVDSRMAIEAMLRRRCVAFCYPHGRLNAGVEAAVEKAGYEYACAAVGTRVDRFALSRLDAARWRGGSIGIGVIEREMKWRARRAGLFAATAQR